MKRSQMVDEIHEYLFQNYHNLEASDLLEIIEKAGMLPPEITVFQDEDDIRRNGVTYTGFYLKNEWEEE